MNPRTHQGIIERMMNKFGSGHFQRETDLHKECVHLHNQIDVLKAEKKEMVELLGRIYIDVDQTNGSLYHDTIRKLKEWVNG
jgi:hypothetical protein